ncbi:hypothetical protein Taro_001292 [Colocasia esculenta]|uniref:Uncharacterized protein n=1 Tax=Colocasia esculenta TaxID=4460 RepID=A0A843TD74_COLES|nr:hypothetical protein [Colocasia esculenta]
MRTRRATQLRSGTENKPTFWANQPAHNAPETCERTCYSQCGPHIGHHNEYKTIRTVDMLQGISPTVERIRKVRKRKKGEEEELACLKASGLRRAVSVRGYFYTRISRFQVPRSHYTSVIPSLLLPSLSPPPLSSPLLVPNAFWGVVLECDIAKRRRISSHEEVESPFSN